MNLKCISVVVFFFFRRNVVIIGRGGAMKCRHTKKRRPSPYSPTGLVQPLFYYG